MISTDTTFTHLGQTFTVHASAWTGTTADEPSITGFFGATAYQGDAVLYSGPLYEATTRTNIIAALKDQTQAVARAARRALDEEAEAELLEEQARWEAALDEQAERAFAEDLEARYEDRYEEDPIF